MVDRITIATVLVVLYYGFFKNCLRSPAYTVARLLRLTKNYNVEEAKGAVGFILVVMTHSVFAMLLCLGLKVSWIDLGLGKLVFTHLILGGLLGVGMAGTSAIFSMLMVKLAAYLSHYSEDQIFLSLSSGWLKSYEYVRRLIPQFFSLPLIILQLGCEELVFRSVFLHYFFVFGSTVAILMAALLFTLMQLFQMPTLRSCLFPMIGAILMGFVHGYLFLVTQSLWPLILSHSVFFILLAT
jgi:membrane protease YdiL (CAAX protease family)